MQYFILTSDIITRANTYLNSVGNRVGDALWYDYLTSSIKLLRANRSLPWMRKEYSFPVFSGVLKYPLVDDFDYVVLLNPLVGDDGTVGKTLTNSTEKEFKKNEDIDLAIGWENGYKFLLSRGSGVINDVQLCEFDDEATNYTLTGDASNPVLDTVNKVSGEGSLKFSVTASANTFTISKTIDSVDVSDVFDVGYVFLDVNMPTTLTNIKIRFGTDSGNYYETPAITAQYCGLPFMAGWNQLGASTDDMIETGTVDKTDIKYIAIIGNCTGVTDKGFNVDGLYLRASAMRQLSYNSYNIIKDSQNGSNWQANITDFNNVILWDKDFDDLLLFKALEKAGFFSYRDIDVVQQMQAQFNELNALFEHRYPSLEDRPRTNYYKRANRF